MDVLAHAGQLGVGRDHVLADVLRVRARVAEGSRPSTPWTIASSSANVASRPSGGRARRSRRSARAASPPSPPRPPPARPRPRSPPPAATSAAGGGDDAVRAGAGAAHGDLHPGLVLTLPLHREMAGEALELEEALRAQAVTREELGQLVHLAGPKATSTNGNIWNTGSFIDSTSSRRSRSRGPGARPSAAWPRPGGPGAGCRPSPGSSRC